MDLLEELKNLSAKLNQAGIDYALCGGLALAIYARPRATLDINMMVDSGEHLVLDLLKIDMSSHAVTMRLKMVNQLRRTCLSLADSSAGKKIQKQFSANKSVQRTSHALGR